MLTILRCNTNTRLAPKPTGAAQTVAIGRVWGCLPLGLILMWAANVYGQQRVSLEGSAADRIEEIVVTAQKRLQPLQDVAASVALLSGGQIKQNGIKNISDLGFFTPGLVVSTNGTAGRAYVRGVGNNLDFLGSQGAVAIHVDGVYQSRQWGVFYDLLDVEKIEVLRGPQGTIYGRNATGGSINVISNSATEDLAASLTVSAGNFSAKSVSGYISSPLSDHVYGRLAVARKFQGGFTDNRFPEASRLDDQNSFATRGELKMLLHDKVNLRLMARYFERDDAGNAIVPTVDGIAASFGARPNSDPFEVRHNRDTFFEAERFEISAITTWNVTEGLEMQSVSAHHKNRVKYELDTDGTEIDAVGFLNGEQHKQFSQELRLYSVDEAAGFMWQLGAYYLYEDTSDEGIVFVPVLGFDVPVAGEIDGQAYALFAQGTYDISASLSGTVGARYNAEKKKMTSAAFGDDQATWRDWTYHAALEYRVREGAFLYGSISKGFKSGGYNVLAGGEKVDPEYVWNYEVGAKTQWFGDKLLLNGSMFYSKYDDQQVNTFTGAGLALVDNAAQSNIYGVELDMVAAPVSGLRIGLALNYLNAVFDRYVAADPFLGPVDLAGSRLSHAPKFSVTFHSRYNRRFRNQASVTAHFAYAWQDRVKYDVFDASATNQAAYGIANIGVAYTNAIQNWKVGLFIRNLTDKVYFSSHVKLNFTPDGTVSFTGEPRTFGIEVTFNH